MTTPNNGGAAKVDVLAVMDAEIADMAGASYPFNDEQEQRLRQREAFLREARAAVAELIEQRDALVGVVFGLIQSLPKGPRSLSSNALGYVRDGATLACAIFDKADVDPEAFSRYSRTLWGTEYRTNPDELKARYAAAIARVGGAA